ncbi:MAG TPA: amidohydrolase family protein, partial [Anaerolineaceae bacterium]|nr:amidohydrolase family protein [Anaerolineaceae bacterium]
MKKTFAVLLLGLAACVPLPPPAISAAPTPVPADAWVIRNGALIDGVRAEPIPAAVVVIRGERIWAAGAETDFQIDPGVTAVDAGGGTILPGLIDAHTHYTSPAVIRQVFLQAGVTAVCDTGSSRAVMPYFTDPGSPVLGPAARGFRSGPMLAPPDAYPGVFFGVNVNYEVSGADAARAAVADLAGRGADYIKISLADGPDDGPGLTLAETRAAVAAAHAHGLLARVHARSEAAFRQALEAGADVIEHAPVPDGAA